jgi:hypothetical protein
MTSRLVLVHQAISSAYEELEGNLTELMDDLWKKIVEAIEPQSREESLALLGILRDAVDLAFGYELTRIASKWSREKFPPYEEM